MTIAAAALSLAAIAWAIAWHRARTASTAATERTHKHAIDAAQQVALVYARETLPATADLRKRADAAVASGIELANQTKRAIEDLNTRVNNIAGAKAAGAMKQRPNLGDTQP